MRPPAFAFHRAASLVLPTLRRQEGDVDAPDDDGVAGLDGLRSVHQIAPHDVPASVIVVRLDSPRPGAALRLQGFLWRRCQLSAKRQIGEALLRHVGVLVFFVGADGMKAANAEDANDRAKDVRLFEVQVDQIGGFTLDVFDRLLDVNRL